jgi:hypothetical protein
MRWPTASMTLALVAVLCSLAVPGSPDVATASIVNDPASRQAVCGGGLRPVGNGFCTHGGDLAPGSFRSGASKAPAMADSRATDPCVGDGVSGRRVRVYYGYPSDTPEHASTYRTSIRESVALADANLDAQTPGTEGQHLRIHCRNGRRVTVGSIALLPIGGDNVFTFDDVINALVRRVESGLGTENIETPRFTYVVFVDNATCCYGPAGQGTIYWDDRPDPDRNFNNRVESGPRFAMVEISGSTAADAFVFLHEVGHTIGAVQVSAPHSTGAGHCYTSVDVMCSFDGGPWFVGGGTMVLVCAQPPVGQFTFDCQGDDYYEVDPAPGSFLANHWNTADSGWLTRPG